MSIVNRKLNRFQDQQVTVVEEIVEPRKSTFTALNPLGRKDKLLKYISGKEWTVNFYGQLLNDNTPLNHLDLKEGKLAKSYVEILDLTLKVQSDINFNYDEEQGVSTVEGSAIVPVKIVPNPGDFFLANVDTGEDVIFVVNSVRRLSLRKESLYEINYSSLVWVNDNPEYMENVESRINETYYYDSSIDGLNTKVLINKEEKLSIDQVKAMVFASQHYYFDTFRQDHTASFLIPGNDTVAYDQVLESFITKSVNVSEFGNGRRFVFTNHGSAYKQKSIYDALLYRIFPTSPLTIVRRFGFFDKSFFFRRSLMFTTQFYGVNLLIHPIENRDHIVLDKDNAKVDGSVVDVRNDINYSNNIVADFMDSEGNQKTMKLLPDLFEDDYYVVSSKFYEYIKDNQVNEGISRLEIIIANYLRGDVIDIRDISDILKTWESWSMLHKLYILPVMWLLTRVVLGEV